MIYRIGRIENLGKCTNLKVLKLRQNLIHKIEGLESNPNIEELELYDNKISEIENIGHLTKLLVLDLSFNKLKRISGLEGLKSIKKLFLSSNTIRKVLR